MYPNDCDPDDVFRTRKGVCAGYSSLFKQMCSIAGVKCEEVIGYAKGASYKIGQKFSDTNHAWNMVYLEGRWHLLDSTWGAGSVDKKTDSFEFSYKEYYFLTHPALFIGDHYPEEKECQQLEPLVSLKHFEESACLKSWFYNAGLVSCQPETCVIETAKGKVSITIESRRDMLFTFSLDGNERNGVMKLLNCGMKLDVYPQKTGQHELQLFAKEQDDEVAKPTHCFTETSTQKRCSSRQMSTLGSPGPGVGPPRHWGNLTKNRAGKTHHANLRVEPLDVEHCTKVVEVLWGTNQWFGYTPKM
ncbi:PREDICTED: kyphoscoliosis peptidase-like [Nanorana parkeri]|uniref:kyphoscoliosis peptidase-like n=1 Tax=Nanorana parkeri TaxID=125878 RepID=UPI0008544579|nr:PREDICTED: kyphoscoliosis peptidase-like [Nanorana parkeri]